MFPSIAKPPDEEENPIEKMMSGISIHGLSVTKPDTPLGDKNNRAHIGSQTRPPRANRRDLRPIMKQLSGEDDGQQAKEGEWQTEKDENDDSGTTRSVTKTVRIRLSCNDIFEIQ